MRAYRPIQQSQGAVDAFELVSDAEEIFRLPEDMESSPIVIIPSVSVGNVGQLAIDLLVESSSGGGEEDHARLCGVVHHPLVLPCYGGYPYSLDTRGGGGNKKPMAHPIDIYHVPQTPVFVLQQRAPAAAGCQMDFAMDLMGWLAAGGVTNVWIVGGLDATLRRDEDIGSGDDAHLRYVMASHRAESKDVTESCLLKRGIQALCGTEQNENSRHWKGIWDKERVHMPWALLDAAKDAGLDAVGVFKFVLEGDNTADAQIVARAVIDVVFSSWEGRLPDGWRDGSSCLLKEPPSWHWIRQSRPTPPGYVF
ncbi:hypothetical protein M9435_003254 [Picochlorum sp. BPE23]|nr:hypothetical protein M9435_003254 [Picochlorum sp. BPE23]